MAILRIDGRAVEYEVHGDGPAVVLCSPTWWPLDAWRLSGIPELATDHRVVVFNQRGIGASEGTPDDYSVPMLAEDTLALVGALGIDTAHLVGFAIGSSIAVAAALKGPERVRSVVTSAPGGYSERASPPVIPASVTHELEELGYEGFIRGHALNDDFAFSPGFYRAHRERAAALADAMWEHAGSEAEFLKHVIARQGWDILDGARGVTQPALVLTGAEDHVQRGRSTPVQLSRELAESLPHGELALIPEARHMVFWESPEACWTRVREFFQRAQG